MTTSRRAFLMITSAAGATLALGLHLEAAPAGPALLQPGLWLRMGADGRVTVTIGKSEMGQGVRTSLPMIVAEELGVAWSMVELTQAEPGAAFPHLGTGGSRSIESLWVPLRQAAATARELLVAAAAARWGVPEADCSPVEGAVVHTATGRRLAFGNLVAAASRLPVPAHPALKPVPAYGLVGRSTLRSDGPRLVDGTAQFGLDLNLPGMKVAVVSRCPVFGGQPATWDAARAKALPGVTDVVRLSTGIAVVAASTAQASATHGECARIAPATAP